MKVAKTAGGIAPAAMVDAGPDEIEVAVESAVFQKMKELPQHQTALGVTSIAGKPMESDITVIEAQLGGFLKPAKYSLNAETGKKEEIQVPDPNYYMQVGYDRVAGDGTMHYRYVVKTALEETQYIETSPFQHFDIVRGQAVGSDSYFDLFAGHQVDVVGQFKGLIRVYREDVKEERARKREKLKRRKEQMQQKIGETKTMMQALASYISNKGDEDDEDEQFDHISKMILSKTKVIARVYILDAFGVAQKDEGSLSDPYLVLKLGDSVFNEKDHYQENTSTPQFFKMFELNTVLPGASVLKIQLFDHDDVFADDKIGQTAIDLEDRFFSVRWNNLKEKPIETRPLYLKTSKVPQGAIRMWLEILHSETRANAKVWDIAPRPAAQFEARLIIWETEKVPNADDEGTSDLYIRAWINDSKPKETDTHYRCQTGKGSFNWRLKFPLELPCETCVVNIQIWDRDMLSFNDFIADSNFSFNVLAKKAWETGVRLKRLGTDEAWFRSKKMEDKFWVQCMKKKKNGELEPGGRVLVSFEIVPAEMVKACPVGEGRDQPNTDPFLPPPIGRFQWSWNPCKLLKQTVGPEVRCKLCMAFCCILCVIICIFFGPLIVTNLIGMAIYQA